MRDSQRSLERKVDDHMVLVSGESQAPGYVRTTKNQSTLVSSTSFNFLYSLTVKIISDMNGALGISNIILIELIMLSYTF